MSVLVKGMEMPINCMACKIKQRCFDCWLCPICKTGDKRPLFVDDYEGRRHPNCPLVEIPSKHGDLIDRDFLNNSNLVGWQKALVKAEINEAPTIIEAEG